MARCARAHPFRRGDSLPTLARLRQDDDALERRQVGDRPVRPGAAACVAQELEVAVSEELLHGAEDARAALLEDVADLAALHPRVERHEHAARALEADRRDDPLVDVRRPDRHAVAAPDPGGHEGACGAQVRRGQLAVRQRDGAVLDRVAAGEALAGGEHEGRDGAGERGVLCHALRYDAQTRA